ncbi:hypothetical protein [Flavobacterium alkalisoli]|uniref:hypothetical protein n=1 Tax=Flavobacterium alkalisoli TaxID=2602769 RepID=UPI003A92D8D2
MENIIGQNVTIYFNLHKKLWSVKHKGKVVAHVENVTIQPTKYHVNENARLKVINQKCRSVHAWINGKLIDFEAKEVDGTTVSYNPYKLGQFYDCETFKAFNDLDGKLHFNSTKKAIFYKG